MSNTTAPQPRPHSVGSRGPLQPVRRSILPGILPQRTAIELTDRFERDAETDELPTIIPEYALPDAAEPGTRSATVPALREALAVEPLVLITDAAGIARNRPDLQALRQLFEATEVWVEPGVRYGEQCIDFIVAGAAVVVLNTETVAGLDEVEAALELSPNVAVSIAFDPARERIASPNAYIAGYTPERLARELVRRGIRDLIIDSRSDPAGRPWLFEQLTRSLLGTEHGREHERGQDQEQELRLFARGAAAYRHREWLLDGGWYGIIVPAHLR